MTPVELLESLKSFSIERTLKDIIAENEGLILEMNKQQLFEGRDTKGNIIGVYSPFTEEITRGVSGKGFPKRAGEPYNIFASGVTANSIHLKYGNGKITFFNTNSELPEIFSTIKKHGFIDNPKETLFGVTIKDGEVLINNILSPELTESLQIHIQ